MNEVLELLAVDAAVVGVEDVLVQSGLVEKAVDIRGFSWLQHCFWNRYSGSITELVRKRLGQKIKRPAKKLA